MKKILSLGLLTLIFSLGANNVNAVPFNYKYEIRTNSLSYNDQLMGYSYKKIFIEIYEKICLLLPENYHDEAIRKNIDKFKINKEILRNREITVDYMQEMCYHLVKSW